MDREDFTHRLAAIVGEDGVRSDHPLSSVTTFGIGGPAQWLVEPATEDELIEVIAVCGHTGIPFRVMGLGSNILVSDEGVSGVVIRLADRFSRVTVSDDRIITQAGASNEDVARMAWEAGLSGYEFASGIPGTIGGAAIMNAGAYDGEFKDVAESVRCLDPTGKLLDISAEDAQWGYRTSRMQRDGFIIVGATLRLHPDARDAIRDRMDDLRERRMSKQPLEMPSAGSTFKRPEGYYAGKLIQDAGMQGASIGGAQVSEKHAGFVINRDGATCADVRELIALIQERVFEMSGVALEPEVRFWHD